MKGARGRVRKAAHRISVFSIQTRYLKATFPGRQSTEPGLACRESAAFWPEENPLAKVDLDLLRHELRTPLTGMLGLAELMAALDLPEKATYWLATLQACGLQLAQLIDRTLQQDQAGSLLGQDRSVDGLPLMESLVAAHWPAARAGGTRLILVFHREALGLWQLDAIALRQALDNLLANAIRFSSNGRVLLVVRLQALQEGAGSLLELAIEDSGHRPGKNTSNLRDQSEFSDRTYAMPVRGRGLLVTEQVCRQLGGKLQRKASSEGGLKFVIALQVVIQRMRKQIQPFRPALLNQIHCLLYLEGCQQLAVAAMLDCLGICYEISDAETVPAMTELLLTKVLICSEGRLPLSVRQCNSNPSSGSTWVLAARPGTPTPDFFCRLLPEPLFQGDLQDALLSCLVARGMAACQRGNRT